MSESGQSDTLSPRGRVAVFAVVGVALLMSSLDQTIVATALDTIRDGTGASLTAVSWTITVYSLFLMVALPLAGTLSDRFGRRRVFLASVVIFTIASLACGLATNIYVLIAFRALQAIGGAGFTPSATGIVVQYFGKARNTAVGLFGSIFPIGATIGPLVGGVLVTYWSWRSVFLVNVPIGLALIPCALRAIPPDRARAANRKSRLDVVGMGMLGAGVLCAMIATTFLGDSGRSAVPVTIIGALAAAVFLFAFWRHITRTGDPFIAPRLLVGRGFAAVNGVNFIYGGITMGLLALVPLYATNRYGMDPLRAGTVLAAESIAMSLCSVAGSILLRRTGYRIPIAVGAMVTVTGIVGLALAPIGMSPFTWMALAGCAIGIGIGSSSPASRNAGLQLAPELASSLAALRTMAIQSGTIVAVSVATAVISRSSDHATGQIWVYAVTAATLVALLPLIIRVPESRGSW